MTSNDRGSQRVTQRVIPSRSVHRIDTVANHQLAADNWHTHDGCIHPYFRNDQPLRSGCRLNRGEAHHRHHSEEQRGNEPHHVPHEATGHLREDRCAAARR